MKLFRKIYKPMLEAEARKRQGVRTDLLEKIPISENSNKPEPFHAPKEASKVFQVNERYILTFSRRFSKRF